MDIGTAKPDAATLAAAPHRLIDVRDPWELYSAGDFIADAVAAIREISAAGNIPLLAGGTMMYFHALEQGLAELPEADPALRAEIDARAAESGWPALHKELAGLDPVAAAKIRPNDAQRIQRALEVCYLSGEPISRLQENTAPALDARFLDIGLVPADRAGLHARIEQRFAGMLQSGFEDEVRTLLEMPQMSLDAPSLRAVGYRQMVEYVSGETDLAEAERRAVVATRRLAKRQLTWMRGKAGLHEVEIEAADRLAQTVSIISTAVAN